MANAGNLHLVVDLLGEGGSTTLYSFRIDGIERFGWGSNWNLDYESSSTPAKEELPFVSIGEAFEGAPDHWVTLKPLRLDERHRTELSRLAQARIDKGTLTPMQQRTANELWGAFRRDR